MTDALKTGLWVHAGVFGIVTAGIIGKYGADAVVDGTWAIPFWVMNGAMVLANVAARRMEATDREVAMVAADTRRQDLEDSRDVVVSALRALESERDKLDSAEYERQRAELLSVGSQALRQLDGDLTPEEAPDMGISAFERVKALRNELGKDSFDRAVRELGLGGGEWRGAAWTAGIIALCGALYLGAADNSTSRAPGAPMTGGESVMGSPEAPAMDPQLAQLEQVLAEDPDNLDALNTRTRLLIERNQLPAAMADNQRVLGIAPKDKTGRAYKGLLAASVGMTDRAYAAFDELTTEDPSFAMAWIYKGLIALRNGDMDQAVPALERAVALEPSPALQQALEQARSGGSLAAVKTQQAPSAPPAPSQVATGDVLVSGTIVLDPAMGDVPPAPLAIAIRDPSRPGPPVAAVKLDPGTFPREFKITTANMVPMGAGRGIPDKMLISVQLDLDGNIMSRGPDEPRVEVADIQPGTEGLTITLTK